MAKKDKDDKDKGPKHPLTKGTLRVRWVHKHKFMETARAKVKEGDVALNHCTKCGKDRAWLIKPNGKVAKLDYAEAAAKVQKAK